MTRALRPAPSPTARLRALPALVGLALGASACGPTTNVGFEGERMHDAFPFNGQRVWTYLADDASVPYKLVATLQPDFRLENSDRTQIYTIEYVYDCVNLTGDCSDGDMDGTSDIEGEVAFQMELSADSGFGVLVWSYDGTAYDPPLKLADPTMKSGETATSSPNGTSVTSTFEGRTACEAPFWPTEPPECFEIAVDAGSLPVSGTWWPTFQVGIVAFDIAGEDAVWRLREYSFED